MPRTQPFDRYSDQYEAWFDKHAYVYMSEVEVLRHMIPSVGTGVEIGIGTGRFALPLGIKEGVDPSGIMRRLAERKGLDVRDAVAEALPYADGSFDFALMVTTICFVDDVEASLEEVYRILRPGGCIIVGLVDRGSSLGQAYQRIKDGNKFYRIATFYSVDEVKESLGKAGFRDFVCSQTVFGKLDEIDEVQVCRDGYGEGGFVAIRATKRGTD